MKLLLNTILQEPSTNAAYDMGYKIGQIIGTILPFLILAIIGFFIFKFVKRKSKK